MLLGISILIISLYWNYVTLEDDFCTDENSIRRDLNQVWIRNGCQCKCEIQRDKFEISCEECADKSEIPLMVLPYGLDGYFCDKDMEIYCNFDSGRLEINTTEGFRNSNNSMNIGGDYNDSNETICAACVAPSGRSAVKCYKMIGYAPDFYFNIPVVFYPVGKHLIIECELRPKRIRKYFHSIVVLTQINDSAHSGHLNGDNHGEICFVCKHQCPGCTILSSVTKCFKPMNILYLTPNKSSEYLVNKSLVIQCLPENNNARLHINITNVNFTSDSSVELKYINKTVCAYCSSYYFINPKTCFIVAELPVTKDAVSDVRQSLKETLLKEKIESRSNAIGRRIYLLQRINVNLTILPTYAVYLANLSMTLRCFVNPRKFEDIQYNVTFVSLNATVLTSSRFEIEISGTDKFTICVQCGSLSTNFTVRCYKHFSKAVTILIEPQNTTVFLKGKPMDVFCNVFPIEILNYINDINLLGDIPEIIRINDRQMRIENIMKQVCFFCGNKIIKAKSKCYDYYNQVVTISIIPSSPPYYFLGQRLQIICMVLPMDILKKIYPIKINWQNTTFQKDTDLSVTLTGVYVGDTVCVSCGHVIIGFQLMCYNFVDPSSPGLEFSPKYDIFLPNVQITVLCILNPKEFYKPKYGYKLMFNNASGIKISKFEFLMNGLDKTTVCFKCSNNNSTKFLVKCYNLYSTPIVLSIDPLNKYLYPPTVSLDVYCRVKPDEVIDKNLITDILLNSNATQVTRIKNLHFNIPNIQSQKQFCFSCGNPIIANISKCYTYMGNTPTFEIYPATANIFFRNPTTLTCNVTPTSTVLTKFSFDLFFLNKTYYTNVNRFIKVLSVNIPFDNYQICLTCGIPSTNITKCYILKKQAISIEILPNVNYYLVYDDTMDIICQVNPIGSLSNFPKLAFTKTTLSSFRVITQRHYKICFPKNSCRSKFCFTCSDPNLPAFVRCFTPWSGTVKFYMVPRKHVLYYMEPHSIVCYADKPFTKNDSIAMEINGLKLHEYVYLPQEMKMKVLPLHYLLNRRIIAVCGSNFPNMKVNHIYNLTGKVSLNYHPNLIIFMNFYQSFMVVTYFTLSNKNYSAKCTLLTPSSYINVQGSNIQLIKYIGSGSYIFRCPFPNTTNNYILEIKVLNITINSLIIPTGPDLYYIVDSLVECIYVPRFVSFAMVDKRVIGLNPTDYVWKSSGMDIVKKLSLRGKRFCITCRYMPIFLNTKCYDLKANLTFLYYPHMDYYTIYYKDYIVVTYFKHKLLPETISSYCRLKSGSHQLNINGGNITLAIPLWSGTYVVECHPLNSTEMTELKLKVFSDPINLIIYPKTYKITLKDSERIYCEVQPSLNLGKVTLSTMQSFLHGNDSSEMIVPNSVLFHDRCLCFSCDCANMSAVRQCYNFTTDLKFNYKPRQNIYFAWSGITIETYFLDKNKPDRKYLALCTLINLNISISTLGEIHITSILTQNIYTFTCTIPTVIQYQEITLLVFNEMVTLDITPNNTDIYIFSMVMDVACVSNPREITYFLPTLRFMYINSTQYVKKSMRLITIGGVDYDVKDIICVVCGHEYFPNNVSKCFSPYTGDINVTVLPLEWEIYYLMPHTIRCRIVPQFSNYSKVAFFVIGISRSSYKLSSDLTIRINSDKTLINKDICVVCGNRHNMNKSRCYRLTTEDDSRCFDYVIVLIILLIFIVLAMYISNYEVM